MVGYERRRRCGGGSVLSRALGQLAAICVLLAVISWSGPVKSQGTENIPPLPTPRPADPTWVGVWGTERLICSSALRRMLQLPINFAADGDYLVLNRASFEGYEWSCNTTKLSERDGVIRLDGSCNAEGEEYTHWIEFEVIGDGEYLIVGAEGMQDRTSFGRCTKSDLQVETATTWHSYKPDQPQFGTYVAAFLRGMSAACPGIAVNSEALTAIERISRLKMSATPNADADFTYSFGLERGLAEGSNVPGACDAAVGLFGDNGTIYPRLLKHKDS